MSCSLLPQSCRLLSSQVRKFDNVPSIVLIPIDNWLDASCQGRELNCSLFSVEKCFADRKMVAW